MGDVEYPYVDLAELADPSVFTDEDEPDVYDTDIRMSPEQEKELWEAVDAFCASDPIGWDEHL